MDGWNTTFLLKRPIFSGYVSFREGNQNLRLGWFSPFFFSAPSPLLGQEQARKTLCRMNFPAWVAPKRNLCPGQNSPRSQQGEKTSEKRQGWGRCKKICFFFCFFFRKQQAKNHGMQLPKHPDVKIGWFWTKNAWRLVGTTIFCGCFFPPEKVKRSAMPKKENDGLEMKLPKLGCFFLFQGAFCS